MAEPIAVLDSSDEDDDVRYVQSMQQQQQPQTPAAPKPERATEPTTPESAAAAAPPPPPAPVTPQHADEAAGSSSVGSDSTEDKEQMECPICLQTCIHPARLPCGHIFCFLCVKGVANKNRRCAMCRREIPVEFLDHPHLLYKIEETPPTTEDGYQWFYEGRNGWWQYDERTSQEIEDAFKRPDKFCTILVAGYVYVVDFETMLQQRQNEPSRKRLVKRDLATIPKKGVAGLRIDGTADPQESMSAGGGTTASYHQHPQLHHQSHQHSGHGSSGSSVRSPLPALVANNLISTIAATDAAIRIASDIIDSTLAHASTDSHSSSSASSAYDYHGRRRRSGGDSTTGASGGPNASGSSGGGGGSSRQDLLNEVQEALNMSSSSSSSAHNSAASSSVGGGVLGAAVAAAQASTSPRLDFFSQTIDEFRSLALSNIAESSTDSDSDEDDGDDESGVDIGVQHLSGGGGGHHGGASDSLLVLSSAERLSSAVVGGQSASAPASNQLF